MAKHIIEYLKYLGESEFARTIKQETKAYSLIIFTLLILSACKPKHYEVVNRAESKFYNAIEKRDFVSAYEILNELKVLTTSDYDHSDYQKKLLDIRIPFLLENDAWDVAFSELKEYADLAERYEEEYFQKMLYLIANHELKNNNFNNVTQILDYLFLWSSNNDVDEDTFAGFMKSSISYLLSQGKYIEALSLIDYYPISNFEINVDHYNHDDYNAKAVLINEALQSILNKLLLNNVENFPYSELVSRYRPIAKKGKIVETGTYKRKFKTGEKVVVDNKGRVQKDNLGRTIKEETFEYKTEKINYYGVDFSHEDKETAVRRIESKGIKLR